MGSIRPFISADRERVVTLLRATNSFSPAEVSIAEELLEIAVKPLQGDYFAFVATSKTDPDAVIQGVLIVGPVPATAGAWHLYWIAVDPVHQGSGAADELQAFAERFVQDRGGYWLIAETSSQPSYARAHGFYRKHRYAELSRIADYYKPSDDMIIYGKRFPIPTPAPAVLRNHHLRHLPEITVDENIFSARFQSGCTTRNCKADCCKTGVWVDLSERDRILEHAAAIQLSMDPAQQREPASWFEPDECEFVELPSGKAAGTAVFNGACVFLDSMGRCVLQKASNATTGNLKPFFCVAFPITLKEGRVAIDEGKSPMCCTPAAQGSLSVLDVHSRELKFVLGDDGFAELTALFDARFRI